MVVTRKINDFIAPAHANHPKANPKRTFASIS